MPKVLTETTTLTAIELESIIFTKQVAAKGVVTFHATAVYNVLKDDGSIYEHKAKDITITLPDKFADVWEAARVIVALEVA